jgi:5,10-methylenetetrahydromethanopterin reductase
VRVGIAIGSEAIGKVRAPAEVAQDAVAAERAGFRSGWTVHMSRGIDALSMLALAGALTSRIELGVGVVPTYPRHPHALAQQAATVQSLLRGRLTLGVGVSHRAVIEELFGLPYKHPAAHMRDFLSVLVPLLRDGTVTHRHGTYTVDGGFMVPRTSPVSVVVGALGPRMLAVAGEHADGAVTWLAGAPDIAAEVTPVLRKAADSAGRPTPRLIAAVPAAVTADPGAARQAAAVIFARYEGLPNYQRLLARQQVGSVADLAIVGDEDAVAREVRAFAEAGATELWAIPFPAEPGDTGDRTRAVLAALARDDE